MTQTFHIVPEGSTGTRRAVMIGINYTGQDGELKGCQNDVKNVSFLTPANLTPCYAIFITGKHSLLICSLSMVNSNR